MAKRLVGHGKEACGTRSGSVRQKAWKAALALSKKAQVKMPVRKKGLHRRDKLKVDSTASSRLMSTFK
eukprot:1122914-Pleurochrysis_carterae.AAC.1